LLITLSRRNSLFLHIWLWWCWLLCVGGFERIEEERLSERRRKKNHNSQLLVEYCVLLEYEKKKVNYLTPNQNKTNTRQAAEILFFSTDDWNTNKKINKIDDDEKKTVKHRWRRKKKVKKFRNHILFTYKKIME
jgi:hypothetical protein